VLFSDFFETIGLSSKTPNPLIVGAWLPGMLCFILCSITNLFFFCRCLFKKSR
jgi:hypothetical protein